MTAAHLDYDALADLAEGVLDEASATSAQAHLSDCTRCRDRAAEVAEVTRVLAEAPVPPMPANLVERLDAAIAAEAASHLTAHRRGRRFQFMAAAAAAVVVVGGGGIVARTVLHSHGSDSAAVSQRPVEEPSRADARGGTRPGPEVARSAPYAAVHSGRRYTSAALAAQVAAALSTPMSAGRHVLSGVPGLDGCVERVGGGKLPLLVDSATYDGRLATVIALPGVDAQQADVWVVGPRCSAGDTDLIAHRQIAR